MTPTADEMARSVSRLLLAVERDDEPGILRELTSATEDAATAGMTLLSLAYVASRDVAAMARETDSELSVGGVYAGSGPLDIDDPRHMAMLLMVATANTDNARRKYGERGDDAKREALLVQVDHILERGRGYAKSVMAVLMGMAVAQVQDRRRIQHPREN